jgi:hypothetical protein
LRGQKDFPDEKGIETRAQPRAAVPHKQPRQKDFPDENGIETIEKPGPEQYVLSRQKEFPDEKGTEQQATGYRSQGEIGQARNWLLCCSKLSHFLRWWSATTNARFLRFIPASVGKSSHGTPLRHRSGQARGRREDDTLFSKRSCFKDADCGFES